MKRNPQVFYYAVWLLWHHVVVDVVLVQVGERDGFDAVDLEHGRVVQVEATCCWRKHRRREWQWEQSQWVTTRRLLPVSCTNPSPHSLQKTTITRFTSVFHCIERDVMATCFLRVAEILAVGGWLMLFPLIWSLYSCRLERRTLFWTCFTTNHIIDDELRVDSLLRTSIVFIIACSRF